MADPDKNKLTEIELEGEQRNRLMKVFGLVETYDEREAVIAFCQRMVSGNKAD